MFRIYVACLASYNAGILHGKWIEVSGDVDELKEKIAQMLKESSEPYAEEWAVHDHEGFGGYNVTEYPDLDDLCDHVTAYSESGHPDDLIEGVCDNLNIGAREAIEYIDENYKGVHKDLSYWAENYLNDTGVLDQCCEHLRFYIDFDMYGRDCELNGDISLYQPMRDYMSYEAVKKTKKKEHKTTYARLRDDLDAGRDKPPLVGLDTRKVKWDHEKFPCWQPDELDNEEFNLILWDPVRKVLFRGSSIDFDYS